MVSILINSAMMFPMSMKKIIHIIGRSPPGLHRIPFEMRKAGIPRPLPTHYSKTTKHPYWVGFFEGDFYDRIAQEILKVTNIYDIECWRPYDVADRVYSKTIQNVKHRIFPSKPPRSIGLKRKHIISGEYSPVMIKELKKEIENGDVLLHLHGFPGGHNDVILKKLDLKNTPLIVQHRGGTFRFARYPFRTKSLVGRMLAIYNKFYSLNLYKQYLKNVDYFLIDSKYMMEIIEGMGFNNIVSFKEGVDQNIFKRGEKASVRNKLGLSTEKKIILYIGRLYREKGVDKIINVFTSLKSKLNLELVLIGGRESDVLYSLAKESGARVIMRVEREKLIEYYQAADVLIMISDPFVERFGGFGSSPLEGLMCGLPLLSTNLIHFKGADEELKQLGEIPQSRDDREIERSVLKILDNPSNYSRCREIAIKHYASDMTIKRTLDIYEKLFVKYHSEEQ